MLHSNLRAFEPEVLNLKDLPEYDRQALTFFIDKSHIADPLMSFTVELDITYARRVYDMFFKQADGASFTAYLTWSMFHTFMKFPQLSRRYIGNTWYTFKNIPLFFPVATGRASRLVSVLIENVASMTWEEFCFEYRAKVDLARSGKLSPLGCPEAFYVAHHVANLPHLRFSGMKLHRGSRECTFPMVYFGERYFDKDKLMCPLFAQLHHSNGDPELLSRLLGEFQNIVAREGLDS